MSMETADPGHGHSPAAWTAVIIMLVAFIVGTVAFYFSLVPLVYICGAVVLVGLLVGYIMRKLGYGVNGPKYTPKDH